MPLFQSHFLLYCLIELPWTQHFPHFHKFLKFFRTIWDVPKIGTQFIFLALFQQFSKTQFAPKMTISMIWSCPSVLPSQNHDAHLFHVEKNPIFMILMILIILWFWV